MGRLVSHFHETDKRQCADTLNRPAHKAGISGAGASDARASDFFGPRFLSPHVNNEIPDFYLLPISEINTILDVTCEDS